MGWNVAFYGPWIDLGKKTSATDVMLASHSDSGGTFSYAAPAMYPEKVHSLIMPAMMSSLAVVHYTPELQGAALGETLVLLDLLRKPGIFAMADGADADLLGRFTKGTTLESWPRAPDTVPAIREEITKFPLPSAEGPAKVVVDASFEVKSVGTVVLGLVQRGKISVHDKLTAYPSGSEASIRSIQKQDKNFTDASCGDRVGLALKGTSVDEVPRGTILSAEPIPVAKEFPAKITLSPHAKSLPNDLHLCLGLQWGGVRAEGGKLVSDKAFALDGVGIVAHSAKPGSLRVLGRAEL